MDNSIVNIFKNSCFWAPCFAWTTAQFTKMLCSFYRTHRLDFSYMVSTGGMPSAHSALVAGLATSVGLKSGFGTPIFAISLAFALIVMFDASTVRNAAGQQAKLLNEIMDEFFKEHRFSEKKLKELLGHTRLEVFMGMIIGIIVGTIVFFVSHRI
jgi:acid phosphatase family membrane protein YuiD